MIFIFLILAIVALLYVYLTWNFDYWSKRGIPAPKAKVFFGDLPNGLTRKKNVIYDFEVLYK
jgi:cytochrome P450 family 28